jgi:hypothetical protein
MDALIESMSSFWKECYPILSYPLSKDSINLVCKACDIYVYIDEGNLSPS